MSTISNRIAKLELGAGALASRSRLIMVRGGRKSDDVTSFLATKGIVVEPVADLVMHLCPPDDTESVLPLVLSSVSDLAQTLDHIAKQGRSLVDLSRDEPQSPRNRRRPC